MNDLRTVFKDMGKQRITQYVTGFFSCAGVAGWLVWGVQAGAYIAALCIILFAVATIKWIDDEEKIEENKKE